jgi:hypothetical protein
VALRFLKKIYSSGIHAAEKQDAKRCTANAHKNWAVKSHDDQSITLRFSLLLKPVAIIALSKSIFG